MKSESCKSYSNTNIWVLFPLFGKASISGGTASNFTTIFLEEIECFFTQDSENKLIMYANGNNGPVLICLFLPLVNN